ncbi:sigma 54-interacting transcriptional regulator [Ekhidna sp.]|uniref:sigma-54 interaction domain-containing protein n=1 Tax=Ekhidna sp. TaxID=2608089 RepID=UPI003BA854B2
MGELDAIDQEDLIIKLREAENRVKELEEAFHQTKTGIWEYNIDTEEIVWSKEVYEIYGLAQGLTPPRLEEIIRYSSPEEQSKVELIIMSAIAEGIPYSIFCEIEDNNGKHRYVRATGVATKNNLGQVIRLSGTICDLSEHNENQQNLKFSDFTIESISDGIYWFDDDLRFVRVNQAAADLLDYKREELIGKKGIDINPRFSMKKSISLWKETKEKGSLSFITNHRRKDGSEIPVEITNNIINWKGKEFKCSVVRDITERKNNEKILQSALDEIKILKSKLEKENKYLRDEINIEYNFDEIVAENKNCKNLLKKIEQVSRTSSTVLILGETGTGKELFARAIHNLSDRNSNTLIKVNCAALPIQLAESELFGHEKGSFTGAVGRKIGKFEVADKSSIFLDEVGELPMEVQAKLLRVLQEGEFERVGGNETIKVDVRIIAATNKNLEEAIKQKEFREDLFYRLNVFPIYPSPLRNRKSDIPALVAHFLKKFENRMGKKIFSIPNTTMEKLLKYDWPGNIRELENIIERAMITSEEDLIVEDPLIPKSTRNFENSKLEDTEKQTIIDVLIETQGKVSGPSGAAEKLGVNPKTLESKIRKFNIDKRKIFN